MEEPPESSRPPAVAPPAAPAEPAAPAPPPPERSPLRQFLGLFVVPLVVVLIAVLVFVGFGWIAMEEGSAGDYLNDLRSPWPPRRRQAAYELSRILNADPQALAQVPGATGEVRRLFAEADDDGVRQYLALVIGRTGDREAVPLLVEALDDEETQTRIYALFALGDIGDERALEPVLAVLTHEDPGLRKTAAYALGALGDRRAIGPLQARLEDAATDVRWNAALALARLGSDAGVETLEQMLDRRLVAQVPGITPEQQEEAMLQAVPALAAVRRDAARSRLESLAREDPSLKVRQAAIEALAALDETAPVH